MQSAYQMLSFVPTKFLGVRRSRQSVIYPAFAAAEFPCKRCLPRESPVHDRYSRQISNTFSIGQGIIHVLLLSALLSALANSLICHRNAASGMVCAPRVINSYSLGPSYSVLHSFARLALCRTEPNLCLTCTFQHAHCTHHDLTCSRPLRGRSTASGLIVAPRSTPDSLVRMAALALCRRARSCSSPSTSSSTYRRDRVASDTCAVTHVVCVLGW